MDYSTGMAALVYVGKIVSGLPDDSKVCMCRDLGYVLELERSLERDGYPHPVFLPQIHGQKAWWTIQSMGECEESVC